MTKRRSTKGSFLMSLLSLFLCFSMLLGTTFAWFTDAVTSGNNVIETGNLDVNLYHTVNGADVAVNSGTELFNDVTLWEPGAMVWEEFTVANEGNLALKYQFTLNALNATVIDGVSFASMLKVAIVDGNFEYTRQNVEAISADKWQSLETFTLLGELEDGEKDIYGIIIWWQPTDNDNHFNMNNGNTDTVSVEVSVNLVATQVPTENDSFGPDYDVDAQLPNVSSPVSIPAEDVVAPVTINSNNMQLEVPAEIINNLPAEVTSMRLICSESVVETNEIHFAYIELVDQNGAKIDFEGNTAEFAVTLPAQTTFAPGTTVEIYHDGEKMAIASVADDGTISYTATHFSKVDVTLPKDAYYVATYDEFYNEVYYGGTVIPTADIELSNFLVSPNKTDIYLNGKNITGQTNFFFYAPIESALLSINGEGTVTTNTGYVSMVTSGGTFVVNGGTFNLGNTNEKAHFYTQNSGKTIINGGTFISNDADTPILYCINGFIEINGGFFQNTANPEQSLLSMGNNINYINNQKITLSGGTFVNWNPMDSSFAQAWSNPDVPALIVLADGYQMISETQTNGDVWYSVVPVQ